MLDVFRYRFSSVGLISKMSLKKLQGSHTIYEILLNIQYGIHIKHKFSPYSDKNKCVQLSV